MIPPVVRRLGADGRDGDPAAYLYEVTLDLMADGVVIADADGRIVVANERAVSLLAAPGAELRGRPVEDFVPGPRRREHAEQRHEFLDHPTQRGMAPGRRVLVERPGAAPATLAITLVPITLDDEPATLVRLSDVSEASRAIAAEQWLLHLMETSGQAMIGTDRDGMVVAWNPAAAELFGWTADEMVGRHVSRIAPDDLGPAQHEAMQRVLGGETMRFEAQRRHRDGSVFPVGVLALPRTDAFGDIVGALGVIEDLTPKRQAELALRQRSKELERSNTALERFAYAASHDLQEPVRMVGSFAQLLERRYRDALDDDGREMLDILVDAAGRMQTLVNDLLAYSRADHEREQELRCDATAELQQSLDLLAGAIAECGARLEVETELPELAVDPVDLRQIWRNLIGNSLKHRGDAEPVVVIGCSTRGAVAELRVSDNGPGIAPQHHEAVFEPFRRVGATRTKGAGFGLALCRRIVESYGGEISIASPVDGGTTIAFTLPTAPTGDPITAGP